MKAIEWIKRNKLTAFLLVILLILIGKSWFNEKIYRFKQTLGPRLDYTQPEAIGGVGGYEKLGMGVPSYSRIIPPPQDIAPAPDVTDRLVIRESTFSLLVKNVRETVDDIIIYAKNSGGYMVNSSLQSPLEAPTATLVIRVPSSKLTEALTYLRGLAIKVVSENISGEDVTDQYVDNEARLATLNQTKAKFQEIFDRASEISDILNIQRELINLQSQIDAVKGQQQYLEKSAQVARITIYLSTDEIALPYAPSDTWRPSVIFKLAVRSLISNLRSVATIIIWSFVYSVIWIPILLIFLFVRNKLKKL